MTRIALALAVVTATAAVAQKPTAPKPQDTEVWQPVPPVVTPGPTDADRPSDAIVLFDGKNLDQWVRPTPTSRPPAGPSPTA